MSRKTRYLPEEKEQAVIDYIKGNKTRAQICSDLNISTRTIQDWAGIYNKHGITGFQIKKKNQSYSKEFKHKVVEEYKNGYGSSIDLALKYDISSGLLRRWIRQYNDHIELKDYDPKQEVYMAKARRKTTIDKAMTNNPEAKPLFHSDRGFQYTSKVFQRKLKDHEIEQSMSRVGRCIDNGPTEGFWGIIKSEMYQLYDITNESSLRFAIKDYIRFYSEERPQDRYHCKTPLEVRNEALSSDKPMEYPIPRNKRIEKYKEKWCA